jgi:hypothetical protein
MTSCTSDQAGFPAVAAVFSERKKIKSEIFSLMLLTGKKL